MSVFDEPPKSSSILFKKALNWALSNVGNEEFIFELVASDFELDMFANKSPVVIGMSRTIKNESAQPEMSQMGRNESDDRE